MGTVRAFDAQTGGAVWESQTPSDKGGESSLYGGGVAFDNGRIYATNGLGYVAALDARTGGIVWKVARAARCAARRPSPTARSM